MPPDLRMPPPTCRLLCQTGWPGRGANLRLGVHAAQQHLLQGQRPQGAAHRQPPRRQQRLRRITTTEHAGHTFLDTYGVYRQLPRRQPSMRLCVQYTSGVATVLTAASRPAASSAEDAGRCPPCEPDSTHPEAPVWLMARSLTSRPQDELTFTSYKNITHCEAAREGGSEGRPLRRALLQPAQRRCERAQQRARACCVARRQPLQGVHLQGNRCVNGQLAGSDYHSSHPLVSQAGAAQYVACDSH